MCNLSYPKISSMKANKDLGPLFYVNLITVQPGYHPQYNIPFSVSYTGTWNRRNRMGAGVAQNHPSQLASFSTAWIIPENTQWILMDRKHPKQLLPMRCRALQGLPFLTTTLCSYLPLKKMLWPECSVSTFMLWSVLPSFCGIWIKPSYTQNLYFTTLPSPFSAIWMKIRLLCRRETESTDQFDFVCLGNECLQAYQNLCELSMFWKYRHK